MSSQAALSDASKDFHSAYFILLLVTLTLTVFVCFYFNRLVAAILSYFIRAYIWHKHRASISLKSIQISILGGRVFFKGFRYQGSDLTVLIHSGVITWHYWRWRVSHAEIYTDGGGGPASAGERNGQRRSTTLETEKGAKIDGVSSSAVDALETGGVPQAAKKAPARVSIKFDGVELFVYNWSPSIDALAVHLGYANLDSPLDTANSSAESSSDEDGNRTSFPLNSTTPDGTQGRATGVDRSLGLKDSETVRRIRQMFKTIDPIGRVRNRNRMRDQDSNDGSDTEARDPPPRQSNEKPDLPGFLALLPISISINKGSMGIGNENTTHLVVINFREASGGIDAGMAANSLDVYRQYVRIDLEKTTVKMLENPDFKEGLLERGRKVVGDVMAQGPTTLASTTQNPTTSASATQGPEQGPRNQHSGFRMGKATRSILSRLRPAHSHVSLGQKSTSQGLRPSVLPDIDQTPDGPRWLGLARYLTQTPISEKVEWADIDYAVVSTVLESGKVGICYYWDVPGDVPSPEIRANVAVESLSGGSVRRNRLSERSFRTSMPPAFGLDLALNGGVVTYGPWADRTRAQLQSVLFPNHYRNTTPRSHSGPKAGDPRAYETFKVLITAEKEVTVRFPFREASKDFKWKGMGRKSGVGNNALGATVRGMGRTSGKSSRSARSNDRKSSTRRWNRKKDNKGETGVTRPHGWVDLKLWPGTSITYTMGMIPVPITTNQATSAASPGRRVQAPEYTFHNSIHMNVSRSETSTSVNQDLFWKSGPVVVTADMPGPCVWNSLREWRFGIDFQGIEILLLRDHVYLITDLIGDWSSSIPIAKQDGAMEAVKGDYYTFVPIKYFIDFRLNDFSFLLNTNPSNVINTPSDLDENDFLIIRGDTLTSGLCIPDIAYKPERNEMMFDLVFSRVSIDLGLPPKNTGSLFLKDKNVGKIEKITLDGTYAYSTKGGAGTTDQLVVNLDWSNTSLILYGTFIQHLSRLKDNYIGDFVHFSTLDEFKSAATDKRSGQTDPLRRNVSSAGPTFDRHNKDIAMENTIAKFDPATLPARSSDLDIMASVLFQGFNLIIPANVFDPHKNVASRIERIGIDVRVTNYYMDMTIDICPFGLGCGDLLSGRHRDNEAPGLGQGHTESDSVPDIRGTTGVENEPTDSAGFGVSNFLGPIELFIDSVRITSHRLFGLPNSEPAYTGLWVVQAGSITGEISIPMLSRLMGIGQALPFSAADKENGVDLSPGVTIDDITFVQVRLGRVKVAIVLDEENPIAKPAPDSTVNDNHFEKNASLKGKRNAIVITSGKIRVEFNDWHRKSIAERLSVVVPEISLSILEFDLKLGGNFGPAVKDDGDHGQPSPPIISSLNTLAHLTTSVSSQMVQSPHKNAYWAKFWAQQAHVRVHDSRTARVPFLFLDEIEDEDLDENGRGYNNQNNYPDMGYQIDPPLSRVPDLPLPASVLTPGEEHHLGSRASLGSFGRTQSIRSKSSSLLSRSSTTSRASLGRSSFIQAQYVNIRPELRSARPSPGGQFSESRRPSRLDTYNDPSSSSASAQHKPRKVNHLWVHEHNSPIIPPDFHIAHSKPSLSHMPPLYLESKNQGRANWAAIPDKVNSHFGAGVDTAFWAATLNSGLFGFLDLTAIFIIIRVLVELEQETTLEDLLDWLYINGVDWKGPIPLSPTEHKERSILGLRLGIPFAGIRVLLSAPLSADTSPVGGAYSGLHTPAQQEHTGSGDRFDFVDLSLVDLRMSGHILSGDTKVVEPEFQPDVWSPNGEQVKTNRGGELCIQGLLSSLKLEVGSHGDAEFVNDLEEVHIAAELTKILVSFREQKESIKPKEDDRKAAIKFNFDCLSISTELSQIPGLTGMIERSYPIVTNLMMKVPPQLDKVGDSVKLDLTRKLLTRLASHTVSMTDPVFLSRPTYLTPDGRHGVRAHESWKCVVKIRAIMEGLSEYMKGRIEGELLEPSQDSEEGSSQDEKGDYNFVQAWGDAGGKPEWFARRPFLARFLDGKKSNTHTRQLGLDIPLGKMESPSIPEVEVFGRKVVIMCDEGDNASMFQVMPLMVKIGIENDEDNNQASNLNFITIQVKADDLIFGMHWNMVHAISPVMDLIARLETMKVENPIANPSHHYESEMKGMNTSLSNPFPKIHLITSILRPRVFVNTPHLRLLLSFDQFAISACSDITETIAQDVNTRYAVWSTLCHAVSLSITIRANTPDRLVAEWFSLEPTVKVAYRNRLDSLNLELIPEPDIWKVTGTAQKHELTVHDQLLDLLDLADLVVREEMTHAFGFIEEIRGKDKGKPSPSIDVPPLSPSSSKPLPSITLALLVESYSLTLPLIRSLRYCAKGSLARISVSPKAGPSVGLLPRSERYNQADHPELHFDLRFDINAIVHSVEALDDDLESSRKRTKSSGVDQGRERGFHPISTITFPPINGSLTFHDYWTTIFAGGSPRMEGDSNIPIREINVNAIAGTMRLEATSIYHLLTLAQKPEVVATVTALKSGGTDLSQYINELFSSDDDSSTPPSFAGNSPRLAPHRSPVITGLSPRIVGVPSINSSSNSPVPSFQTIHEVLPSGSHRPNTSGAGMVPILVQVPSGESIGPITSIYPTGMPRSTKPRLKINADFSAAGVIIQTATPGIVAGCNMVQLDIGFSGLRVNVSVDPFKKMPATFSGISLAGSHSINPIIDMEIQNIFANLTLVDINPESKVVTRRLQCGRVSAAVEIHSGLDGDGLSLVLASNKSPEPLVADGVNSTLNSNLSRDIQVILRNLHITLSPRSVAGAVDVIKHLENRLRDVDLSRQRQYLRKLRHRREERIREMRARGRERRRERKVAMMNSSASAALSPGLQLNVQGDIDPNTASFLSNKTLSTASVGYPDSVGPASALTSPPAAADGFVSSVSIVIANTAVCWILNDDALGSDDGNMDKNNDSHKDRTDEPSSHSASSPAPSLNLVFAIERMIFSGRPSSGGAFLGIWNILLQLTPETKIEKAASVRVRNSVVLPEMIFRVTFEEEIVDGYDEIGSSMATSTTLSPLPATGVSTANITSSMSTVTSTPPVTPFSQSQGRAITEWRLRLSAVGKALEIDLDSRFIVPLIAAKTSISGAMDLFQRAFVWGPATKTPKTPKQGPTDVGDNRGEGKDVPLNETEIDGLGGGISNAPSKSKISIMGNKRLASCMVEIDLAGAVVHLSSGGAGTASTSGMHANLTSPGPFSPSVGATSATTTLKSPGFAIKTEYLDNGHDASFTGEIMVTASTNEVYPSVVGLLMDISDSVKEVVSEEGREQEPEESKDKVALKNNPAKRAKTVVPVNEDSKDVGDESDPNVEAKSDTESDSFFDPALLLAKTRFSFGIRICKQDFTLTSNPYSQVIANATIDEIYITTNTLPTDQDPCLSNIGIKVSGLSPKADLQSDSVGASDVLVATAKNNFLALSARISAVNVTIRHQFSRDFTFQLFISSAVLSVMNSKHVSGSGGVAGLSAILRIGQVKIGANARQGHNFMVFREIWDPEGWSSKLRNLSKEDENKPKDGGSNVGETNVEGDPKDPADNLASFLDGTSSALERYQAYSHFSLHAAVVIDGIFADVDLGTSIGKTKFRMGNMWVRVAKESQRQTGWLGIEKIELSSEGRTSGFVELDGVRAGSVVEWCPETVVSSVSSKANPDTASESLAISESSSRRAKVTTAKGAGSKTSEPSSSVTQVRPLIQVSAGFKALRAKVLFDYKPVLVAKVDSFDFLMHNKRVSQKGGVGATSSTTGTTTATDKSSATTPVVPTTMRPPSSSSKTVSDSTSPESSTQAAAKSSPLDPVNTQKTSTFSSQSSRQDTLVAILECTEVSALITPLSSSQCVALIQAGEKLVADNMSSFDTAMDGIRVALGRRAARLGGEASLPSFRSPTAMGIGSSTSVISSPVGSPVIPGLAPLSMILSGPVADSAAGSKGSKSVLPVTPEKKEPDPTKVVPKAASARPRSISAGTSSATTAPKATTTTITAPPLRRETTQTLLSSSSHRNSLRLHTDVVVILGQFNLGVFPDMFSDDKLVMLTADAGRASFSVVPGLKPLSGAKGQTGSQTTKDGGLDSNLQARAAAICSSLGLTLGHLHLGIPSISGPILSNNLANLSVEDIISKANGAKGGVIMQVPKLEAMMRTWQSVSGEPNSGTGDKGVAHVGATITVTDESTDRKVSLTATFPTSKTTTNLPSTSDTPATIGLTASVPPPNESTSKGSAPLAALTVTTTDPTYTIDYLFKSTFAGQVDVGWNYSRVATIRGMFNRHSAALAEKLGKPLPQSAVKIKSSPMIGVLPSSKDTKEAGKEGASTTPAESGAKDTTIPVVGKDIPIAPSASAKPGDSTTSTSDEKLTAVVNVPQPSTKYNYVPLLPPVIQAPKLRAMGEATPPLEWIGFQRDKLPNLVHQIVIVPLVGVAKEVEDVYGRILGQ